MVSKGTRPGSRPIKSPKPTPPRTKRPKLSQEMKTKTTAKSSSSSEDESEDATGIGLEEVTTTSGCSSSAPGDLILSMNGHPESDHSDSHSGSTRPDLFVRHRAQRKFAQGVSLALFSVHHIQPTPPPTPLKLKPKERSTPTKKVPLPHFSPPVKRPKTEDFINFLCYRGTPALPKSLKFFNYPSPFEHLQQRSAKSGALNLKTMASKNLLADKESISSRSRAGSICSEKFNNHPKFKSSATSSNNKKKPSSFGSPQGLPSSSNSVVPLGSPTKPTHINEQEAKFALSALKLKYQEKLSKDKRGPVSISKLVKKAKVRSAILTRSKSKDDSENEKDEEIGNKGPTSTPKVAKKSSSSIVVVKESESASRELKRTLAPSPDIIDGVGSRGSKIQHGSSTSSFDSDRAEHSYDSSGESSTESSSFEPEEGETENFRKATIRTLRSGNKSIHSVPKAMSNSPIPIPKDKTNFTKTDMERNKKKIPKKLENNRVSTRSAHRTTASPLRELPMYNEVKKKNKKEKKKNPTTQQSKPKLALPESEKHLKSNDKSGAGSISSRRPSRRTKENAALFLGFITHAFSSDENDDDVGKGNGSDGGNSSAPDSCDTSSSETKFLESKYKAIMKRDQDKLIPKNKSHSSSSTPTSRANFLKKLRMGVNSTSSKNSIIKAKQTLRLLSKTKSKTKPEKRLLRSQSIKEELPNSVVNSGVCRVTRRRSTVPVSPRDKQQPTKILGNRHAGAVRKTTKIVPRKNNSSKTSDTESQTHSEDSESSSSSDDEEIENSSASESSAPVVPETKPQVSVSSSSDQEEDEADEPRMEVEKVPRTVSPDLCDPISRSEYPAVGESSEQSEVEEGGDNGSGSDSDSVIIERVEIAIQVDMDLEEGIIEHQSPPPPILSPQLTTPYLPQPPRTGTIGVGPGLGLGISIPLSVQQQHLPPQNPSLIRHPIITTGFNGNNFFTPQHHAFHHHTSSTVEFISQHRMTHTTHQTQDFSGGGLMIPGGGGTTLLPVPSGPFHNYGSHVPHSQPISMSIPLQCFSTSQHTATTLETHIRSVAANLDIPLVRPIVTPNSSFHPHHQIPISMGMSIPMPLVRPNVLNTSNSARQPLTRPIVSLWNNPHSHQQQSTSHFSAFRSPNEPHFTQSYQQYSRPLNPTVSVSAYPGLSAHGLSLIQSLPNVSIVPKFDRNSKPLVNIPPPESFPTQTSSNSAPTGTKTKPPKKQKEPKIPKERGRKRKIPVPFPPSSPLTVRKDSVNPATYAGTSSKKNIPKSSSSGTSTEIERSAQEIVIPSLNASNSAPEHTTEDSFTKLLQASKSKTPSPLATETAGPRSGEFQSKTSELKSKKGESTSKSEEPKLANNVNQPRIDSKPKNHVSSPLDPKSPSTTNIKVTKKDSSFCNSRPSSLSSKDSQASSRAPTSSSDKFSKPPKLKKSKSIENMNNRKKSDNRATPETISKAKKPEPEYQKGKVESPNPHSPVPISKSHHHKSEQPQRPSSTHSHNSNPSEECEHVSPLRIHSIPTYHPSEQEFQDPFKFIAQIQKEAEQFGMAKIIPPKTFRPECNVEDDMRFTAYNHYIHRMYSRWGPNVQERLAMLENLRKSEVEVSVSTPPQIGGMEIDLSTLYHTVQNFGGLTEVIQKDRWNKVSDAMHIPKAANDRASKLDAIYVKYVLPYEMLSDVERKRLHAEVNEKWKERLKKDADESESESEDENPYEQVEDCIVKGKSTPLSSFFRIGRNTLSMLFQSKEPSWSEVESRYWKLVKERDRHLCVYSGSIDCTGSTHRSAPGFPTTRAQTGSKHPWNLKVFANSSGSVLRSLGPVLGATAPTLQIGMIFTTYCWYSDPHGLPWIEYLHTGGSKIWYVVPASHTEEFRAVVSELMPRQCRTKKLWLVSDSVMVPPEVLLNHGVPLYRVVQEPGEFLVVFPKAFTSSICTGYVISESVSFATPNWFKSAWSIFNDIRQSKEPPVFPLEQLLLSILTDHKVQPKLLKMALSLAERIFEEEFEYRKKLKGLGLVVKKAQSGERKKSNSNSCKPKRKDEIEENVEVHECETCNYTLVFSFVLHKAKEIVYCLPHAIEVLSKFKGRIKTSVLYYEESETHLRSILEEAKSRLKG